MTRTVAGQSGRVHRESTNAPRAVICIACALFFTGTSIPAQQVAERGTATLRGRVFAADTGQALPKALVQLTATTARVPGAASESVATTTDASGRFEFTTLRAGRYTVRAQKGSYIPLAWGQQRPDEPATPIDIRDGQTIERIDFALTKGGVITGRVVDEFGEPASEVEVAAMRAQSTGGVRRLLSGRTVRTNDIGEFRLYALQSGDYYVSATLRTLNPPNIADDRSGYAPTYFPGTGDVAGAQQITVGSGQTIAEITIPLLPIRTAQITGVAIDSRGRPLQGIVLVSPRSSTDTVLTVVVPSMVRQGQLRGDGSFTIGGLAPGDYAVQVQGAIGNGADVEYASLDVSLSGTDLTGVRIVSSKSPTLSGRIILPGDSLQSVRPAGMRVSASPIAAGTISVESGSNSTAISGDWSFQVKSRPGQMRLNVLGLQAPWTVKAVRYRGFDITDTGLEFRGGEDLTDVEIELTNRATIVTGTVTNTRGEAVRDYRAIVFARDRDKRRPPSRYVRTARPDQDGRFTMTMLPAGDYLAFAAETFDADEATEPDFLGRIESRATRFSLTEGESRRVDLKLTPTP